MAERFKVYEIVRYDQINDRTSPYAVAIYAWAQYNLANMGSLEVRPRCGEVGNTLRHLPSEGITSTVPDNQIGGMMNIAELELNRAIRRSEQAHLAADIRWNNYREFREKERILDAESKYAYPYKKLNPFEKTGNRLKEFVVVNTGTIGEIVSKCGEGIKNFFQSLRDLPLEISTGFQDIVKMGKELFSGKY